MEGNNTSNDNGILVGKEDYKSKKEAKWDSNARRR